MKLMKVLEQQEGRCRNVYWDVPDGGWEEAARHIDPFLADAIRAVDAEYAGDPAEWLVVNHWPDSGRLIVYPAQDGPYGNRGERVCFQLCSGHLEAAFRQFADLLPDGERERAFEA